MEGGLGRGYGSGGYGRGGVGNGVGDGGVGCDGVGPGISGPGSGWGISGIGISVSKILSTFRCDLLGPLSLCGHSGRNRRYSLLFPRRARLFGIRNAGSFMRIR